MIKHTLRGRARRWGLAALILVLVACGGGSGPPQGDIWSGFTLPPTIIQYVLKDGYILDIYINGSSTHSGGLIWVLPVKDTDSTDANSVGWYSYKNAVVGEGSGIAFVDETRTYAMLFGTDPRDKNVQMMSVLKKTHQNVTLDFLDDDVLGTWTGISFWTDGITTTQRVTTMVCVLGGTCSYAGVGILGTVSGVAYSPTTHMWTGYFAESVTGQSGDSIISLVADKKAMFMVNCDTDHKTITNYATDCRFFFGMRG